MDNIEIKTVKLIADGRGYLVNNTISFLINDNNELLTYVNEWIKDGGLVEPEFTSEELIAREQAKLKQAKEQALTQIVVEVEDMSFDGNETARLNMISAIQASELLGQTENPWKLADNTVQTVTTAEIKQALALAIQEVGRIVMVTDIEEL